MKSKILEIKSCSSDSFERSPSGLPDGDVGMRENGFNVREKDSGVIKDKMRRWKIGRVKEGRTVESIKNKPVVDRTCELEERKRRLKQFDMIEI